MSQVLTVEENKSEFMLYYNSFTAFEELSPFKFCRASMIMRIEGFSFTEVMTLINSEFLL